MQYQEAFNTNIVANFLIFSMHPYTPYSVKRDKSYSDQKIVWSTDFSRKDGNINNFDTTIETCFIHIICIHLGTKAHRFHRLQPHHTD
jgi:hypothetical protein